MEMTSPSLTMTPSTVKCRVATLTSRVSAPPTHALPPPRGARALAAPRGQNSLRGNHSAQIVGVGLPAYENHPLALGGGLHRPARVEDGLTHGRTRRGCDARRDRLR